MVKVKALKVLMLSCLETGLTIQEFAEFYQYMRALEYMLEVQDLLPLLFSLFFHF